MLGSGRVKRQHGLVRATIKARCQLLKKKNNPPFEQHLQGHKEQSRMPVAQWVMPLWTPVCKASQELLEPWPRFSMTFISSMLSETNAKRGRGLPHSQLTSSASYTLLLLLSSFPRLFAFVVYQTPCPEILTGPSVDLTSPENIYKKIQTCLNQEFSCSTTASTLRD